MRWLAVFLVACASQAAAPPPDVATGEVDAWQPGPPLPVARANHCAVAIDDWVLAIGGNHADGMGGFVTTDEIDAAQLQPDGTLGPWQVAGHLPSAASECTATSDGRTLYVIDGLYANTADGGQVWSATLDDSGVLSPLASLGALPAGVVAISSGAAVRAGNLVVAHSRLPADGDATETVRAQLSAFAWTTDAWNIPFRAQASYAFTADHAYALGGYHDPAAGALADTFVGSLAADGAVSGVTPATPLPIPVAFGEAAAVDHWMFVAGGRANVFGGAASSSVYAAPLAADGTLGAWQPATALPAARTNHAMVVVGDFLVVTGGGAGGPGDTTVLVARVRFPPQ